MSPTRPVTPDSLGPELVAFVNALIAQAERSQGSAALGEVTDELCRHYRALAICIMGDDGDVDGFFHWLLHSPLARRHYLTTVASRGLGEPKHSCSSFVDPVLDAMAARQWGLAADIVRLTSAEWLEGEEYEDDFCYGDFLRKIVTQSEGELDALLGRWRKAVEGANDPRLRVAEAFRDRDAGELQVTLGSLLRATEAHAQEMADPSTGSVFADDYPFFPNRWISIEGMALLAAAERAGIPVDYELATCPRAARTASYAPFRPRAYPNQGL
jgi:hypothetical protein